MLRIEIKRDIRINVTDESSISAFRSSSRTFARCVWAVHKICISVALIKGGSVLTSKIVWLSIALPRILVKVIVETRRGNRLKMQTHRLRFVNNPLQTVNQIFVVLVAVKYIKGRKNEFVFIVDQLLQQLNVIWVSKVVTSETVDVRHELLFAFGHGALWAFTVGSQLLRNSIQLEAELNF